MIENREDYFQAAPKEMMESNWDAEAICCSCRRTFTQRFGCKLRDIYDDDVYDRNNSIHRSMQKGSATVFNCRGFNTAQWVEHGFI